MSEFWADLGIVLLNTISMFDMLLIAQTFLHVPMVTKKWKIAICAGVFIVLDFLVAILTAYVIPISWLQIVYMYLFCAVVIALLMKQKRWLAILIPVPACLIYLQWGQIFSLIEKLFGMEELYVQISETTFTLMDGVAELSLLIILCCVLHFGGAKRPYLQLKIGEIIFLSIFCFFTPLISIMLEIILDQLNSPFYSLFWIGFMLVLSIGVFYAFVHRGIARYYRALSEHYKETFDSEYSYFQDYKEQQQDMAKFRHDWKNHMLLLQTMMENQNYEKAKAYFNDLTDRNEVAGGRIVTGNEILDIILSAKSMEMESSKIECTFNGGLEALHYMESVDCCVLFSNLIDNAIEANCKYDGKRWLRIHTIHNHGHIVISIENQMNGELKQEGEQLLTTKEDSSRHGIGMQNAIEVIRKYNGEYQIQANGNTFAIRMLFPIIDE